MKFSCVVENWIHSGGKIDWSSVPKDSEVFEVFAAPAYRNIIAYLPPGFASCQVNRMAFARMMIDAGYIFGWKEDAKFIARPINLLEGMCDAYCSEESLIPLTPAKRKKYLALAQYPEF